MSETDLPSWITDALRGLAAPATDEQMAKFREQCRRYDEDPAEQARIAGIIADVEDDGGIEDPA
jgi:hypothetical protein